MLRHVPSQGARSLVYAFNRWSIDVFNSVVERQLHLAYES